MDNLNISIEDKISRILTEKLTNFPWKKSMLWGKQRLKWIRPLHSVLCILGGEKLNFSLGNIKSVNYTLGHQVHSTGKIKITSAQQYLNDLRDHKVIIDQVSREKIIKKNVNDLISKNNLLFIPEHKLLLEVTNLVEWPSIFIGKFNSSFLDLPEEVLISSMQTKQRYFPLKDKKNKKLTNKFIIVSNIDPNDKGSSIIKGNEKVLNARLSDAQFFWELDKKIKFDDNLSS